MNDTSQQQLPGLDDFVESYETALASTGRAELDSYLPRSDHPDFVRIVAELMRVDLEHGWTHGEPKRIPDYRSRFSELCADPRVLSEIAFEEFRQRRRAGAPVVREEYSREYGIDVSSWPAGLPGAAPEDADDVAAADADSAIVWGDDRSMRVRAAGPNTDNNPSAPWESPLFDTPALLPGGQFAGCEIVRELGRGASSRVYLARQRALANRLVVLKVTPQKTVEPDRLARLQHTHIVPIYSVHQVENLQAICMPYFGATTLGHWVQRLRDMHCKADIGPQLQSTVTDFQSGTWRPREAKPAALGAPLAAAGRVPADPGNRPTGPTGPAEKTAAALEPLSYERAMLALAAALARGLAHAHDQGILHLDLKPANVLLTDDGRPMLLDFHLAAAPESDLATSVVVGGTLPYMSPEQIRSLTRPELIDARSDIYSFGCVFYELLTGRLPFPVHTGGWDTVLPAMLRDRRKIPSMRVDYGGISRSTEAIIRRCLNPDPGRRYQTAEELAEDIERQQLDLPLRFAGNPSLIERTAKWIRRHPRSTSGVTVTLIAVAVLAVSAVGWRIREEKLATLEARQRFVSFTNQVAETKALLSMPVVDQHDLPTEISRAKNLLSLYGVMKSKDWTKSAWVTRLPPEDRRVLLDQTGELLHLLAATQTTAKSDSQRAAETTRDLFVALDWNSRALGCFPSDSVPNALWIQRAGLLKRLKRESEADEVPHGKFPHRDVTVTDRVLEATNLILDGKYHTAASLLEILLREAPREFKVWSLAGNCHFARKDFAKAEGCYSACISLRPDSYHAYYQRGVCRLSRAQYGDARSDFERCLALIPNDLPALVSHALALDGEGHLQEAIQELTLAINGGFPETRVYFMRETIYRKLGQNDLADRDHQQLLIRIPRDPRSWVTRGVALIASDPLAALRDFQSALKLDDRAYDALLNIAHVQSERLHEPDEAIETLNRLIELTQDIPLAFSGRGVLYARQQHTNAAQADAQQALEIRREPMVVYQVGCIAALCADSDEAAIRDALPFLAEAVMGNPSLAAEAAKDADLKRLQSAEEFRKLLDAAKVLADTQAGKVQTEAPVQPPKDAEVVEQGPVP